MSLTDKYSSTSFYVSWTNEPWKTFDVRWWSFYAPEEFFPSYTFTCGAGFPKKDGIKMEESITVEISVAIEYTTKF